MPEEADRAGRDQQSIETALINIDHAAHGCSPLQTPAIRGPLNALWAKRAAAHADATTNKIPAAPHHERIAQQAQAALLELDRVKQELSEHTARAAQSNTLIKNLELAHRFNPSAAPQAYDALFKFCRAQEAELSAPVVRHHTDIKNRSQIIAAAQDALLLNSGHIVTPPPRQGIFKIPNQLLK